MTVLDLMIAVPAFKPQRRNANYLPHTRSAAGFGLALALACFMPTVAEANDSNPTAEARVNTTSDANTSSWNYSARAGAVAFTQSRSLALEHIVKSSAALSATATLMPRLELGVTLSGVLTTDDNYGVWAAYAQGRYQLYRSNALQLGLGLGVGIGHNAPILHDDLQAELPVVPHAAASFDALWNVGEDCWLGPALTFEQLSVLHLAAQLRWGR